MKIKLITAISPQLLAIEIQNFLNEKMTKEIISMNTYIYKNAKTENLIHVALLIFKT